ncbi:MAG: DUF1569 domain-containing protein [Phycisphaerales bacterium]|nr:MAG: DUF1569 domain-containing protein [Phycisphaerales bacterium]
MLSPASKRRRCDLQFGSISEVLPEVKRLLPAHQTFGNWSLGQICDHLAKSFVGSMEGFDLSGHRLKRFFIRRRMLEVALTKGIPRGWTVDSNLTPMPEVDLREAVEALTRAVERYRQHDGRLHAHPLFGNMPRDIWDRVHCVHCAHHLSFAVPE